MPRVSVVIPTFGRPELLTRAVRSVLDQSMSDLEVIVVNDGDDPPTASAVKAIDDPRVRFIAHDRKRGAGQARDTGADASTGQWVAFLDDDDEWLPQKLERQLAVAPTTPAVLMTLSRVVTPLGTFVRPTDSYRGDRPFDEWLFDRHTWLKGGQSFLQTSSLMMPRAMFDQLHFRETKQHEEWELVIRATKQLGYAVVTAPEPLVIHYLGFGGPSLSKTYTWKRSLDWLDSMGDLITPRAYAGFCLTVIARAAANAQDYGAITPLLSKAMRHGRPTARQLFAFSLLWAMPEKLRRRVRAGVQGEKPAPGEQAAA